MIDIAAVVSAATSAMSLFDKIADQVERFLTKSPKPAVPKEHRMIIVKEGDSIVSREHGQVVGAITGEDLKKLPEFKARHIAVLEKSMERHYSIWESVYPQLALIDSPIQKAKVERQLEGIIRDMKGDLEGILSFLESCGLRLDDHYMHIRHLVSWV